MLVLTLIRLGYACVGPGVLKWTNAARVRRLRRFFGGDSKGWVRAWAFGTRSMSADLSFHDYGPIWERGYFTVAEQRQFIRLYPRFSRDLPWVPPPHLKNHPVIARFLDDAVTALLAAFPHRRRLTRQSDVLCAFLRCVSLARAHSIWPLIDVRAQEILDWFLQVHEWFTHHVYKTGCDGCASAEDLFAITDGVEGV